jgi:hypothetical protein
MEQHHVHGVSNQDTLVQLLLLDKLLYVFGHDTVVVLRSMEGLAMIP